MKNPANIIDVTKKPGKRIVHKALREFQAALQELYQKDAPILLIYGSYARHEATASSDTDVLLLYPKTVQPGQEIQRLSPILADLNLKYQVLISILPAFQSEFNQSSSPFWENLRRESIPIDAI